MQCEGSIAGSWEVGGGKIVEDEVVSTRCVWG